MQPRAAAARALVCVDDVCALSSVKDGSGLSSEGFPQFGQKH